MIRKCLAITLIALIVMFNVVPAQAYTPLVTPVSISASGTLTGVTVSFVWSSVTQGSGTTTGTAAALDFGTVSTAIANSGEALMMRVKSNDLNNRVIIYTDNATNTAVPNKKPVVDLSLGIDGGGMVGQTNAGYVVPLIWGMKTDVANGPNNNTAYTFGDPQNPVNGAATNCVYVVDKSHTTSLTGTSNAPYTNNPAPFNTAVGMDSNPMFSLGNATATADIANPASAAGSPGLYPQAWDADYYDKSATDSTRKIVSPALYSSIATIAFGIGAGGGSDATYYVASVPNITTTVTTDSTLTRISKADATVGTEIYVAIGGDFTSKPAQKYGTDKLYLALVQN